MADRSRLAEARELGGSRGEFHPGLLRDDDQSRLGRIAQHRVNAVGAIDFGIVA